MILRFDIYEVIYVSATANWNEERLLLLTYATLRENFAIFFSNVIG